jgi:phospholipid transport system substrate-binding protein
MILWSAIDARAAAETESPTQLVQRLVAAIKSIKVSNNSTLSPTDQAANAEATKTAHALLDIPGVSQRTLGRHWQERTPAEREEFVKLLTQLFAKIAYPKSAEFFSSLEMTVKSERIKESRAVVMTTIRHPKEGLVSIDYQLIRSDSSWRIQDILLDDVSLALNLQSQFNKVIVENSYAELLRRMREKLTE